MKDFIYKKLLTIMILCQPIIDIISSYMTLNGYNITIGIITKVFVMILACIYLVFLDSSKRKNNLLILIGLAIFGILNIWNNLDVIKVFSFTYFNYLFKYFYHLIIILFFIRWFKCYDIKLYQLRIPIIIIVFTYILSLITNSAYLSYDIYRKGYSGWYSSANELGNLLTLLLPVCIYNAFHNKDGIKLDIILVFAISFCLLMLGTKVGLLGFYLIIICYLILRLFYRKKLKINYSFYIILGLFLVTLPFIPKMPTIYNVQLQMNTRDQSILLSGREKYYERLKSHFEESSFSDKLIGLSYYEINEEFNEILIVEQDFLDILFMYGIIGLLIILAIYIYIYVVFIKKYFYYRKKNKYSKKYIAIIVAVSIELAIAFISGHSLLSPSVSTYLCLIVSLSLLLDIKEEKSKKENILLSSKIVNDDILNQRYDVSYVTYSFIIKSINDGKIIGHLFNNRFVAYLLSRNQKYDYAIIKSNDNLFLQYYIYYCNAKEKYVLGKKNKLFKNKINSVERLV